ncbi:hypothetical protein B7463_g7352, partial [Scytalidium lignicola]
MDGPAEEFGNVERIALVEKLQQLLAIECVPPNIRVGIWLSDLDVLRVTVREVENNGPLLLLFSNPAAMIDYIIKPWMRRNHGDASVLDPGSPTPGTPSASHTPTLQSSPGALDASLGSSPQPRSSHKHSASLGEIGSPPAKKHQRTGSSTDLGSGAGVQQGSNVSGASTPKRLESVKRLLHGARHVLVGLKVLLVRERIARWQNALFTEKRTEVCENLMTMCPNAYAYWRRAYFTLKPIEVSEDKEVMKVKLFWLRKYEGSKSVSIVNVPELPSHLNGINNVKLFNNESEKPLHSGEVIFFKTEDPVKKPLPSMDILDMQWVLHRFTALSGGAELINYTYNSDDPDDYNPYAVFDEEKSDEWDEWDYNATAESPTQFARELSRRLASIATSTV